jgi:hypothetical protein
MMLSVLRPARSLYRQRRRLGWAGLFEGCVFGIQGSYFCRLGQVVLSARADSTSGAGGACTAASKVLRRCHFRFQASGADGLPCRQSQWLSLGRLQQQPATHAHCKG